jgi:hypothetical protein|tara:strand:+ start:285 stop:680 length:396 start_codon:yes stop_codon:yes gene_type:complete
MRWFLRRERSKADALWSRFYNEDGLTMWSIENAQKIFPAGEYKCVRDWYHTGDYETFEIIVAGRDRILFHGANYARQLEGCVAPGQSRGLTEDGDLAVWNSKKAHQEYMASLDGLDEHSLTVFWADELAIE